MKLDNLLKAFDALRGSKRTWTRLKGIEAPVEPDKRLYVIVRDDLSPGLQISQSIHAKDDFTYDYPSEALLWRRTSNTIIVLSADAVDLEKLLVKLSYFDLKHSVYMEPDLYGEVTAVAVEPSKLTASLLAGLPLALKDIE